MKSVLTLFAFFLFSCLSVVKAQENLKPGKIILKDGQELEGYIDYKGWKWNPKTIKFTMERGQQFTRYSPLEVSRVEVEGEMYVGAEVQTEVSLDLESSAIYEKNFDTELQFSTEKVFLRALIEGAKGIYFLRNSSDKDNFYISEGFGFELLQYKRYYKIIDNRKVVEENNLFKSQLADYLKPCSNINVSLQGTEYNSESFISLFQQYYTCTADPSFYVRPQKKIRVEFGVTAGISRTSISFSGSAFEHLVNADFSKPINFTVGLFLELIFPGNQERWSFNNELFYSSYEAEALYINDSRNSISIRNDMRLGFSYLKVNNMVRFKYPIGNLFWFVNGGISNGFAITETNFRSRITSAFESITEVEELALEDPRKYEQGLLIGTGLMSGKFSLELRLESANGIDNINNFSSNTSRSFVLVGYRF